jgi:hypothetical protein
MPDDLDLKGDGAVKSGVITGLPLPDACSIPMPEGMLDLASVPEVVIRTLTPSKSNNALLLPLYRQVCDFILRQQGLIIEARQTVLDASVALVAWESYRDELERRIALNSRSSKPHGTVAVMILDALESSAVPLGPAQLAQIVDRPNATVRQTIQRLLQRGYIGRVGVGLYVRTNEPIKESSESEEQSS